MSQYAKCQLIVEIWQIRNVCLIQRVLDGAYARLGFNGTPSMEFAKVSYTVYIGFLISYFLIITTVEIIFGGIIVNLGMEIFDHK